MKRGLRTLLTSRDEGGYLRISPLGMALIIEDDDLARKVAVRMMDANVPVQNMAVD